MERDLRFPIEPGEEAGREHRVDKNRQRLTHILPVMETLRTGKVHSQMAKSGSEVPCEGRPICPSDPRSEESLWQE
jgi:hypothetical protein